LSVEWDVMAVPAEHRQKYYTCCATPYQDIIFNITLRRKTLFYTVNLITPCVIISVLSIVVFYLPSDSGEKVSFELFDFVTSNLNASNLPFRDSSDRSR
jgi:hypothetical protein